MGESTEAGALDGIIQFLALGFKLLRGRVGGYVRPLRPAHDDAGKWLGNQKAIPGFHGPCSLRLQVKSTNGRACHLGKFDWAHFGFVDRAREDRRR